MDTSNGQTLFEREAGRRFVPASVTKVMTVYTAFKLIDEGALRTEMPFQYTQELEDAWYNEGSNMFLRAGEQPTIGQLLLGITTVSGNDASVALAVAATGSLENWLALMNANAAELGMNDTHFGSPNGYPDGGQTYTSARDLALLGEALTKNYPELYKRYFGHRGLRWGGIAQDNHDPVTGRVDGADGMKTGYTREAGFTFLGSAERDGRRLMMVLAGSPNGGLRDRTARELLEWGFDNFEQSMLVPSQAVVGHALVQDGESPRVALRTPVAVRTTIPRGTALGDVTMEIVYRGPIEAPITDGDRIAQLRVSIDGEPTLEFPLEAAATVERANAWQRIVNAWRRWTA
ncbi:D-alanyl-D-alanine carboxypeptidase family protein [Aurantiacibacter poecillastricola]|uniref:D-alanyl-D-alanine carboxypeptidase family protein n=1 Tax=Aurantiacibacter poecillastricola TaxID=3064385 RepID=UPI0035317613